MKKALSQAFSTEEENGEQKSTNKSISGNLEGDAGGKLLKVFNAELKLDIRGGIGTEKEVHSASREIITKTLHDSAFHHPFHLHIVLLFIVGELSGRIPICPSGYAITVAHDGYSVVHKQINTIRYSYYTKRICYCQEACRKIFNFFAIVILTRIKFICYTDCTEQKRGA